MKPRKRLTPAQRFARHVEKGAGCWTWTGSTSGSGYGQFWAGEGGRSPKVHAHRFAWIQENGPVPSGLYVLHRCDNPRCVRPDHLFLGSLSDNSRDMVSKGRNVSSRAGQSVCGRGHALTPENVRLYRGKRSCKECAREANRRRKRERYATDATYREAQKERQRSRRIRGEHPTTTEETE